MSEHNASTYRNIDMDDVAKFHYSCMNVCLCMYIEYVGQITCWSKY